jgi:hypothetical protein
MEPVTVRSGAAIARQEFPDEARWLRGGHFPGLFPKRKSILSENIFQSRRKNFPTKRQYWKNPGNAIYPSYSAFDCLRKSVQRSF